MNHVIRIITDYSQVNLAIVSSLCLVLCLQGYAKSISICSLIGTSPRLESLNSDNLQNQLVDSPERISFSPSRIFCGNEQFTFSVSNAVGGHRHLPGVSFPYALSKNSTAIVDMNRLLLENVAELTLYQFQLLKRRNEFKQEIEKLKQKNHEQ